MLIILFRCAGICQSFVEILWTGEAALEAGSHRFLVIIIIIIVLNGNLPCRAILVHAKTQSLRSTNRYREVKKINKNVKNIFKISTGENTEKRSLLRPSRRRD